MRLPNLHICIHFAINLHVSDVFFFTLVVFEFCVATVTFRTIVTFKFRLPFCERFLPSRAFLCPQNPSFVFYAGFDYELRVFFLFSPLTNSLTHQITETNKFFHFGPILCSRFSPSATACHVQLQYYGSFPVC